MRLGTCQRRAMEQLLLGREIRNYSQILRGRAKQYGGRYKRSFAALLAKMAQAGYQVERAPGPRGGEWGATYRLLGGK